MCKISILGKMESNLHTNFVQFYTISLNFKLFERGQMHTFTNFQNNFQYSKVIQTFACDSVLALYLSAGNVFLVLFFFLSWICCQRRTRHLTQSQRSSPFTLISSFLTQPALIILYPRKIQTLKQKVKLGSIRK